MDQMVLAAQQWVNTTYAGVTGYTPCPEDGKTGWSVMHSLTRALQRELGITALSDAFGPTTLSRLQTRGGVKPGEQNHNIVKILQSACWCKGYNGGVIDGNYGSTTQSGAITAQRDMGLVVSAGDGVSPKVFKALLTMDAYVVMAGGNEAIRSVQQWLNSRYIARRDFYVIPCDGSFSRDVQKAFLRAIQFELGLTDDQATGTFGPGTQAGLQTHPVGVGDSGIWVQLFTAAMLFNHYGAFSSSFGSDLADDLRDFQEFSELPVTGLGNFATWAQLLVSTGDPARPGTAADCITTVTAERGQALFASGYRQVGRYLDQVTGGLDKKIKPGELSAIFAAGLRVFPISQYYGGSRDYFTYSQGYADALAAHAAAAGHGFDRGTVIYFAVDYDATQEEIDAYIVPYFYGVVGGLASRGKRYLHGVYGSRNVCSEVTRQTSARWSFVSGMSTGFSGNMGFPLPDNWAYNQIQTLTVGTGTGQIEIDKDVHRAGTDPGVGRVNTPYSAVEAYVNYLDQLYALALSYGTGDPNLRVLEWLRYDGYSDWRWTQLIGDVDRDFIAYVDDAGVNRIKEVRDPFYGVDLSVAHFGASANGLLVEHEASGTTVNRGDFAGWGGDLISFYAEWRRDSDSYASGYTYCEEKLAKVSDVGTFKLRDLIEDADAYLAATALLDGGTTIAAWARSHYLGSGYLSRMRRFYDGRFVNGTDAREVANAMLVPGDDVELNAFRTALIEQVGGYSVALPIHLPDDVLADFVAGFADQLLAKVGTENARAARIQARAAVQ